MDERGEQVFHINCEQMNPNNEDFYESDESIEKDMDFNSEEVKNLKNIFTY